MATKMKDKAVERLVAQLTLEEKASLCSGSKAFLSQGISRLEISAFELADGPHGLRKQPGAQDHLGKNESVVATCFPASCALGAGFDESLAEETGTMLGIACQANNVSVLLGPAINIKRSPLCGRNFEYFSEDPLLSGTLGTAWVKALQKQGVGASVKHFLANNQETRRRTQSSEPDERTLREIYASAFEMVVKEAQPWSVMAAYNKIHGVYATESEKTLRKLLRSEWGYDGLVVSDWHAVHDRVAAIKGGCALTMPDAKATDHELVDAVRCGLLDEAVLDEACAQILVLAQKAKQNARPETKYDFEAGHALARKIAAECMVLLKNEDNILPMASSAHIAVSGPLATAPRYQGAGSSRVNAWHVPTMPEVTAALPNVQYSAGCTMGEKTDADLLAQAVCAAKDADIAVIFAGQPPIMESEGFDRWVMKLPPCQNELIEAVCAVQPNTVVVLQNGAPIELPWRSKPKAILEAYLSGEAACEAIWDVLTGSANPGGHLPETFPERIEDTPAYLSWPGEGDRVEYPEGVFVGYRYYASKNAPVAYPFGHGLSYTHFRYSALQLSQNTFTAEDTITASVCVINDGNRAGKALVQLYVGVGLTDTGIHRPVRELRGFQKVLLAPGESKIVTFSLAKRAFAYWDAQAHAWRVPGGNYEVQVCENAQQVLLAAPVKVEDEYLPTDVHYTIMTPIGDVMKNPIGKAFCESAMESFMPAVSKMGAMGVQEEIPYAAQRPATVGLMSEPLQTLQRFARDKTPADWNAFFRQINRQ